MERIFDLTALQDYVVEDEISRGFGMQYSIFIAAIAAAPSKYIPYDPDLH